MKVLVAEDEPVSRRRLEALLENWGYDVVSAASGAEAWELLRKSDPPTLAILDWMMPGLTGPEVCRGLRERVQEPYIYVLLLTAKTDRQDLVLGLEAGADDYITKPFDAQELKLRVRAGRRILELQSELVAAREALRERAMRDPLTGLWNYDAIRDILVRELGRARREGRVLGVIEADLDHFKSVNDVHGHPAGDAVLQEVACRMQKEVRSYDSVGRCGGEEFLVVVPGPGEPEVLAVAERLRASIEEAPMAIPGKNIRVTVSLGIAIAALEASLRPDDLIRAADKALYRAKALGRNRVESSVSEELVPAGCSRF
jgi:two-component system, cell cycle response regulator